MKVLQSREELLQHRDEQFGFLERSADAYDNGYEDEAKRLAVTLRVLLHDSRSSHSLLSQLDEKDRSFYDTAMLDVEGNLAGHGALVAIISGPQGAKCSPMLDDALPDQQPTSTSFNEWGERPIFRSQEGETLSRRHLFLRNRRSG